MGLISQMIGLGTIVAGVSFLLLLFSPYHIQVY